MDILLDDLLVVIVQFGNAALCNFPLLAPAYGGFCLLLGQW